MRKRLRRARAAARLLARRAFAVVDSDLAVIAAVIVVLSEWNNFVAFIGDFTLWW